jgi:hypothetical protein
MCEIRLLTPSEYSLLGISSISVFDGPAFNRLHEGKLAETLYIVISEDSKDRFGLIVGISKDSFCQLPISAPYGMISSIRKNAKIKDYHSATHAIVEYLRDEKKAKGMQITLPPRFYDENAIALFENSLFMYGFRPKTMDVNYHFNLNEFDPQAYLENLEIKARQKLKSALQAGLEFRAAESGEEIRRAYDVIQKNREHKGYPLKLSFEDIQNTGKIISIEYFGVCKNDEMIASAIVYHVSSSIAQVVYWGNLPGAEEYKPMNFLAYALFQHFAEKKLSIVDIGISTEDGVPNFGLCDFKASIGCTASIKPTYRIEF